METARKFQERVTSLAEFRYQLRRFLSFSEAAAELAGISAQQYQLLQVVAAAPTGRLASISYVAERMVLRHNSAVELVGRAERSGLVCRQEDAVDHRRALISLTPEGEAMLEVLVARHWTELESKGPELMTAMEKLLCDGAMIPPQRNETK
jgi:DNA-binding MarR family transcriptional regulator